MYFQQNKLMINFFSPSKNKRNLTQFWEKSFLSSPHQHYYHFSKSKVRFSRKNQYHQSSNLFSWSILRQARWLSETFNWIQPTRLLTPMTQPSASPLLRKRKRARLLRTSYWTFSLTTAWAPNTALTQTAPLWLPFRSAWPLLCRLITTFSRKRSQKGSKFTFPKPKTPNRLVRALKNPPAHRARTPRGQWASSNR